MKKCLSRPPKTGTNETQRKTDIRGGHQTSLRALQQARRACEDNMLQPIDLR
jgi:hypothetical protein